LLGVRFLSFDNLRIIPNDSFIFFHGYCLYCDSILPLVSSWLQSLGDGHTAQPGEKGEKEKL